MTGSAYCHRQVAFSRIWFYSLSNKMSTLVSSKDKKWWVIYQSRTFFCKTITVSVQGTVDLWSYNLIIFLSNKMSTLISSKCNKWWVIYQSRTFFAKQSQFGCHPVHEMWFDEWHFHSIDSQLSDFRRGCSFWVSCTPPPATLEQILTTSTSNKGWGCSACKSVVDFLY